MAKSATVVAIQGAASAVLANGSSRPLTVGDVLLPGEVVSTANGGSVELLTDDGQTLTVGADQNLGLDDLATGTNDAVADVQGLVDAVDAFCETIGFTPPQTRRGVGRPDPSTPSSPASRFPTQPASRCTRRWAWFLSASIARWAGSWVAGAMSAGGSGCYRPPRWCKGAHQHSHRAPPDTRPTGNRCPARRCSAAA